MTHGLTAMALDDRVHGAALVVGRHIHGWQRHSEDGGGRWKAMGLFGGRAKQKKKRCLRVTESRLRNCPTIQPLPPRLPVSDPRVAAGGVS